MAYLENKVDEAKVIPSLGNAFQLRAAAFPVTCSCPQAAHLRGHEGMAREEAATYAACCASKHPRGRRRSGKKRMWVNAATQALIHLDLCAMPLLFIPLRYFPAPVAQHSAETVEQTLGRVVPQRDGSRSWKKSTFLALWVFFPPHPDGIFIFGSSCNYNFRAQDWIWKRKFPPWMPSSAQCRERRSLAGARSCWGGRPPPLLFQGLRPPFWL